MQNLKNSLNLIILLSIMLSALAVYSDTRPTGILNIQSTPSGASVFIDGAKKGVTPLLLEIEATRHQITLVAKGYEPHDKQVIVTKDKVHRTSIILNKKQEKPQGPIVSVKNDIRVHKASDNSAPGTVFLNTTPPNLIAIIDDIEIGQKTPVAFDIRPGIYQLKLKDEENRVVYKKTIFIKSEETLDLDLIIKKKRTIDYSDPWR